jgi:hypothetical protein
VKRDPFATKNASMHGNVGEMLHSLTFRSGSTRSCVRWAEEGRVADSLDWDHNQPSPEPAGADGEQIRSLGV